jgi:hypothetical protein
VLLEAMGRLADRADADAAELVLHGANLEHAPQEFQDRFHALLADNAARCGCTAATGRRTCRR